MNIVQLRAIQLRNCGDWNGEEAMRAYEKGNEEAYCRFISQADRLWRRAAKLDKH